MHILKSAYSEKPSSFLTPESFMFHMAGLSEESVMLWDCVRNTVIDYSMVEDALREVFFETHGGSLRVLRRERLRDYGHAI